MCVYALSLPHTNSSSNSLTCTHMLSGVTFPPVVLCCSLVLHTHFQAVIQIQLQILMSLLMLTHTHTRTCTRTCTHTQQLTWSFPVFKQVSLHFYSPTGCILFLFASCHSLNSQTFNTGHSHHQTLCSLHQGSSCFTHI